MIITLFYLTVIQPGNALAETIIVENGSLQNVNEVAMNVMTCLKNFSLVSATPNILIYNANFGLEDFKEFSKDRLAPKNGQIIINIIENSQKKKIVSVTGTFTLTNIDTGEVVQSNSDKYSLLHSISCKNEYHNSRKSFYDVEETH